MSTSAPGGLLGRDRSLQYLIRYHIVPCSNMWYHTLPCNCQTITLSSLLGVSWSGPSGQKFICDRCLQFLSGMKHFQILYLLLLAQRQSLGGTGSPSAKSSSMTNVSHLWDPRSIFYSHISVHFLTENVLSTHDNLLFSYSTYWIKTWKSRGNLNDFFPLIYS